MVYSPKSPITGVIDLWLLILSLASQLLSCYWLYKGIILWCKSGWHRDDPLCLVESNQLWGMTCYSYWKDCNSCLDYCLYGLNPGALFCHCIVKRAVTAPPYDKAYSYIAFKIHRFKHKLQALFSLVLSKTMTHWYHITLPDNNNIMLHSMSQLMSVLLGHQFKLGLHCSTY